ncbi:Uncharacterised protein [Raoultella ornithinolytica]|jgi:hypothetical protein|nr:hypothetical protein AB00_3821 [Raoultella ornithinolytica 2-156-04_S1_C1]KDX12586.1 hypothetical protein AB28_3827 [Raoultella ornithinolytica 2-156-04_S1_C2]STR69284.1 Uncharacterised protein [Raoultella ornithinolytica]
MLNARQPQTPTAILTPPVGRNYQLEIKRNDFIIDCERDRQYSNAIHFSVILINK